MADLTSAQRLAAYRDELVAAGFDEQQVVDLVGIAAPRAEDVEVQADLDDDIPSVGEVRVRFRPDYDLDDVSRVVEEVHRRVESATQRCDLAEPASGIE